MLNIRPIGGGVGDRILGKIDKIMDACESLVVSTGIPSLLQKVDLRIMEIPASVYKRSQDQRREAEEKDPKRLRYWVKRHDEQLKKANAFEDTA